MTISIRPITPDDAPAWADLLAAVEAEEPTGEHYSAQDLLEELANPELEPERDVVGAFDDAQQVGYFQVVPRGRAGDHFTVHVEGSVRPSHRGRGVGEELVTRMLGRAREVHAARAPEVAGKVTASGLSTNTAQQDLLQRKGMAPERWNIVMRTALADVGAAPATPAGYQVRPLDPAEADDLRHVHNVAFADHPNFTPWGESLWQQYVSRTRAFRPQVSFVALPEGSAEVVAYLQTAEFDAYQEATGRREAYVGKLGTVPAHRGRGLASLLLRTALSAYRDAGYDEASLDVDSENPNGALGLYQRAGFAVEGRFTNYALHLPVRTSAAPA